MKLPLVLIVIVFCLGIIGNELIKINWLYIYGLAVIFLILGLLFFRKHLGFDILLLFLVFFLGFSLSRNQEILPACHLKNINPEYRRLYSVKGTIIDEPTIKSGKTSFVFSCREIIYDNIKHRCCGNILVYVRGNPGLRYGQELILTGNLYRPFRDSKNSRQSYRQYLYNRRIFYLMRVESAYFVQRLNRNQGLGLKRFALWLKAKIESRLYQNLDSLSAGILDAMILGEKKSVPALVYSSMIKSGTVHILVVSGFNVGIVAFIIFLSLKLLRIPRKIRIFIAAISLIVYCLATGASSPVVRATVMAMVFLFAYLVKREPAIFQSCALAALFILAINPRQLFEVSFQLSFACVLSIVLIYPRLKSFFHPEFLKPKVLKFLLEGCLVSLSAWLGTMGLVAYYFRIFSPVTVLANICIVGLATLITLCGFSLVIVSVISPPLARVFALSCELLVAFLLHLNSLLIKLPAAYFYFP